jgi:hypothetical protein
MSTIFSFLTLRRGIAKEAGLKVLWGGLGFSVKGLEKKSLFPLFSALENSVGWPSIVDLFLSKVIKKYRGGVAGDPKQLINEKNDPGLIFVVSIDYEIPIEIPNPKPNKQSSNVFFVSYLFMSAMVLKVRLPNQGSPGELKVVGSFPFRVQSTESIKPNDSDKKIEAFGKLVIDAADYFESKIVSKNYKNEMQIESFKLLPITFSKKAIKRLKFLNIYEKVNEDFVGHTFASVLSNKAGLSVKPYGENELLLGALAERFNNMQNFKKALSEGLTLADTYTLELKVTSIFRKDNGANEAYVRHSRGIQVEITAKDSFKGSVEFRERIRLIQDDGFAVQLLPKLNSFDENFFVQMLTKLLEEFASAITNKDLQTLQVLGIKEASVKKIKPLFEMFERCKSLS